MSGVSVRLKRSRRALVPTHGPWAVAMDEPAFSEAPPPSTLVYEEGDGTPSSNDGHGRCVPSVHLGHAQLVPAATPDGLALEPITF